MIFNIRGIKIQIARMCGYLGDMLLTLIIISNTLLPIQLGKDKLLVDKKEKEWDLIKTIDFLIMRILSQGEFNGDKTGQTG